MCEHLSLQLDVQRARLEEIRREHELGANPFEHGPLGLVSMDFLKQARDLDQLERASYDMVRISAATVISARRYEAASSRGALKNSPQGTAGAARRL
jgi:hypothetical protein